MSLEVLKVYLEEEVYEMLNWGFSIVVGIEFIFIFYLWLKFKYLKGAFIWLFAHIAFFTFAGYKLLVAINSFEHQNPMASEDASFSMGISGTLWILSVACLLIALGKLVQVKSQTKI